MKQIKFLSTLQYFTLLILQASTKENLTAKEMLRKLNSSIVGEVGSSAIYITLKMLILHGLVEERTSLSNWPSSIYYDPGKRPIKSYRILPAGKIVLNKQEKLIKTFK